MTKKTVANIVSEEEKKIETYERRGAAMKEAVKAIRATKKLNDEMVKAHDSYHIHMSDNERKERHLRIANLSEKYLEAHKNGSYIRQGIISARQYAQEGEFSHAEWVLRDLLEYAGRNNVNLKPSDYVHMASTIAYCIDKALKKHSKEEADTFRRFLGVIQEYETEARNTQKK